MLKAWKRALEVVLTSKSLKKKVSFGTGSSSNLEIDVTGTKYLGALKDNFVVSITNLTYKEIIELIEGQFYDVEIRAGYESCGTRTIFKGGVLYISNALDSDRSNSVIILCANSMVAKVFQKRMSLTLNSGINMYAALTFVCKRAGLPTSNISEEFKNRVVRESLSVDGTIGSFLDLFADSNNYLITSDGTLGSSVNLWDPRRTDNRFIRIDSSNVILTSGYPTLTSDGLTLTVMPTFNFLCGDTIQIDNSLLDISVNNISSGTATPPSYFIDKEGKYMIYELSYALQNRGSSFSIEIMGKARSLYNKILSLYGGNG